MFSIFRNSVMIRPILSGVRPPDHIEQMDQAQKLALADSVANGDDGTHYFLFGQDENSITQFFNDPDVQKKLVGGLLSGKIGMSPTLSQRLKDCIPCLSEGDEHAIMSTPWDDFKWTPLAALAIKFFSNISIEVEHKILAAIAEEDFGCLSDDGHFRYDPDVFIALAKRLSVSDDPSVKVGFANAISSGLFGKEKESCSLLARLMMSERKIFCSDPGLREKAIRDLNPPVAELAEACLTSDLLPVLAKACLTSDLLPVLANAYSVTEVI